MSPAPTVTGPATSPERAGKSAPPPMPMVPFTRAAPEHEEGFLDTTVTQTTSAQELAGGFIDVPSFGYMRGIMLSFIASGGTGAAAVYREDAPWSVIDSIQLQDVNGAPIIGPITGYSLFLLNRFGGYFAGGFASSPDQWGSYAAPTTNGNYTFSIYLPCELSPRDGVGSLPNMNSAQAYKLRVTIAPLTRVYSTNPTTIPSLRVRGTLLAWFQPNETSPGGAPQAQQPPALGTTQFVTQTTFSIGGAGQQNLLLPRRGNLIRLMIGVFRDGTGARSAAWPDPIALYKDGVVLKSQSQTRIGETQAQTFDIPTVLNGIAGVFVYGYHYDFDGKSGREMRDLYLPTLQSTRLELVGNFTAAGTLTLITNDVAPDGNIYT